MASDNVSHWLSEAIVDFLRGPLYIHPLMSFIDEKCMIFTPEEENKLEYTTVHNEFKELVDGLLTGFLGELGVSSDKFYEVMAAEHQQDKLTGFVVQTILTVDDFLMFKAMMVKRNLDLTNQVLSALDELHAVAGQEDVPIKGAAGGGSDADVAAALAASQADNERDERVASLHRLMRKLQLQDEDVALAMAIAESLKDMASGQSELAELEQALALSLALEAEQRRLAAARAAGDLAASLTPQEGKEAVAAAKAATGVAVGAGAGPDGVRSLRSEELLYRPFPEPQPLAPGGPLPAAGAPRPAPGGAAPAPLDPLNIGPNQGGDKLSAVAAAAAQAASMLGRPQGGEAGASGRFMPQPLNVRDPMPKAGPAAPKERFVPEPLNLPDMGGTAGALAKHASVRNRAMGYKGDGGPADMAALREAAAAAAATQKGLLAAKKAEGQGGDDAAAQAWLQEAKMKLVAQKNAEREAEMAAYKKEKGPTPKAKGGAAPEDNTEARRAALRDKLAQKMKQDLLHQEGGL